MLEGGTEGSKGHTLVVVPHMTDSYGPDTSSASEAFPLCTLKNFPNRIEHTLQVQPGRKLDLFKFPDRVWTLLLTSTNEK